MLFTYRGPFLCFPFTSIYIVSSHLSHLRVLPHGAWQTQQGRITIDRAKSRDDYLLILSDDFWSNSTECTVGSSRIVRGTAIVAPTTIWNGKTHYSTACTTYCWWDSSQDRDVNSTFVSAPSTECLSDISQAVFDINQIVVKIWNLKTSALYSLACWADDKNGEGLIVATYDLVILGSRFAEEQGSRTLVSFLFNITWIASS
jgi:hypothetical protein